MTNEEMKILDLPVEAKWYNMQESGEKPEEYREIKPFWIKRLLRTINVEFTHYESVDAEWAAYYTENIDFLKDDLEGGGLQLKPYTHVRFRYGYTKRTFIHKIDSITIGCGKPEWGAPKDKDVFIIKHHKEQQ